MLEYNKNQFVNSVCPSATPFLIDLIQSPPKKDRPSNFSTSEIGYFKIVGHIFNNFIHIIIVLGICHNFDIHWGRTAFLGVSARMETTFSFFLLFFFLYCDIRSISTADRTTDI